MVERQPELIRIMEHLMMVNNITAVKDLIHSMTQVVAAVVVTTVEAAAEAAADIVVAQVVVDLVI
tara:strand:+ start:257 stop:451 length:195 start_codon:yes stop_codon:yes gene_type:complete